MFVNYHDNKQFENKMRLYATDSPMDRPMEGDKIKMADSENNQDVAYISIVTSP